MNHPVPSLTALASLFAASALFVPVAHAVDYKISVTIENLAPENSVSITPLNLGFGQGVFDAFDIGSAVSQEIENIAELGDGAAWQAAFLAADPNAVVGTLLDPMHGVLLPGDSATQDFFVDSNVNTYFTFASMVVPSNDFFIGNDDPMAYDLFDDDGNLRISSITVYSTDIWDAGSEAFDPLTGAFLPGANAPGGLAQNSVVALNFAELYGFDGLTTAAGYTFAAQLEAGDPVYRISFNVTPVPEADTWAMLLAGLGLVGVMTRRRIAAR